MQLTTVTTTASTASSPCSHHVCTGASQRRAPAAASPARGAVSVPAAAAAASTPPSRAAYVADRAPSAATHNHLKRFSRSDRKLPVHERAAASSNRVGSCRLRPAPAARAPQKYV